MTGPTHRRYSVTFAFITAIIFYNNNVTQINYYLSLCILLSISKFGALFPDLDHHWSNIGVKTVPNYIINKLIHLTGGKHRSWQTHSIDICTLYTLSAYYIPVYLYKYKIIGKVNKEVLAIILLGFASGWISHLFSDMLTSAGVRLFCFSKFKVKFVPKKIFKLQFNTGQQWENFNFNSLKYINFMLGTYTLLHPKINYILDYVNKIVGGLTK